MFNPLAQYSVLVDLTSRAVLTVSDSVSACVFLNECTPDTYHYASVQYPNYQESLFLVDVSPEKVPEWSWDRKARLFVATKPNAITHELRTRALLVSAKRDTLIRMMRTLSQARHKMRTGIEFQETVYLTKKIQAQAFKDKGYDDELLLEYPYVLQYADFAGISPKEAADDILFKARLDDEFLANTELVRLKYFRRVRDAKTPEEMRAIFAEFIRDNYL